MREYSIGLNAVADANAPSITLSWPLQTDADSIKIYRKLKWGAQWFGPVCELPGNGTQCVDNNVVVGEYYDYILIKFFTNSVATPGQQAYGFCSAGILVPMAASRGQLFLSSTRRPRRA